MTETSELVARVQAIVDSAVALTGGSEPSAAEWDRAHKAPVYVSRADLRALLAHVTAVAAERDRLREALSRARRVPEAEAALRPEVTAGELLGFAIWAVGPDSRDPCCAAEKPNGTGPIYTYTERGDAEEHLAHLEKDVEGDSRGTYRIVEVRLTAARTGGAR